jgi:hypothetical protein
MAAMADPEWVLVDAVFARRCGARRPSALPQSRLFRKVVHVDMNIADTALVYRHASVAFLEAPSAYVRADVHAALKAAAPRPCIIPGPSTDGALWVLMDPQCRVRESRVLRQVLQRNDWHPRDVIRTLRGHCGGTYLRSDCFDAYAAAAMDDYAEQPPQLDTWMAIDAKEARRLGLRDRYRHVRTSKPLRQAMLALGCERAEEVLFTKRGRKGMTFIRPDCYTLMLQFAAAAAAQ